MGHALKTIGSREECERAYLNAIKYFPLSGEAYWSLANLKTYKFSALQIKEMNKLISSKITTAGLVLLGNYSPSSASDYILGSNHILPTNGFGKIRGSLSVMDFIKINTEVTASKLSLSKISKHLDTLTTSEGLPNHYEAVRGRLQ
jgi:histidinol dehydrogenase